MGPSKEKVSVLVQSLKPTGVQNVQPLLLKTKRKPEFRGGRSSDGRVKDSRSITEGYIGFIFGNITYSAIFNFLCSLPATTADNINMSY